MAKGLDPGTMNCVVIGNTNSEETVTSTRNCYIKLNGNDMDFSQQMGNWKSANIHGTTVALADDAITIANWKKLPLQRPMAKGVINPTDDFAMEVLAEIVKKSLGEPSKPKEICYASIPANSTDGVNTIAHKAAIKQIVTGLGYKFYPISEGMATLMAMAPKAVHNGEELPFTGIAMSWGGGMVNMSLGYRAEELATLSLAKSGDWIDQMVSNFFGEKDGRVRVQPNEVTIFKEKYFKFGWEPTDAEIEAIKNDVGQTVFSGQERRQYFRKMISGLNIFYTNAMESVVENFAASIRNSESINVDIPMEIVMAGGTCCPEGFEDYFMEVLEENEFPIQVTGIRKARPEEIMHCTARGAYIRAMAKEAQLAGGQANG